ncbi:MAG: hypothetical protein ACKOSS_00185, partial [Planctomycetia bacterium]
FKQGSEKGLKEYKSLSKQAERKKSIADMRERSIQDDRKAAQEAYLAEARGEEAAVQCVETFLK